MKTLLKRTLVIAIIILTSQTLMASVPCNCNIGTKNLNIENMFRVVWSYNDITSPNAPVPGSMSITAISVDPEVHGLNNYYFTTYDIINGRYHFVLVVTVQFVPYETCPPDQMCELLVDTYEYEITTYAGLPDVIVNKTLISSVTF